MRQDVDVQIGKEYWIEGYFLVGPPMIACAVKTGRNRKRGNEYTTWRLRDGSTLCRSLVSPPLAAVEDDPTGQKTKASWIASAQKFAQR